MFGRNMGQAFETQGHFMAPCGYEKYYCIISDRLVRLLLGEPHLNQPILLYFMARLIALIPARTSLSNVVLCATLRANPSLVTVDRSLFIQKVGNGAD
jgi:hypothetical protein